LVQEWLVSRGDGPWWALLREGIEGFAEEAGGDLVLVAALLDWLAEWGRRARRRQTGLLLLTAHRAKGLEFDDVVVLGGGWDRTSPEEDRDAPRRLYYVAMTRARRSLALARLDRGNPIIDGGLYDGAFLRREKTGETEVTDCTLRYFRLNLSEIDLGFAGRLPEQNLTIDAISRLEPGASLGLDMKGDRGVLLNSEGIVVGRLARKFAAPKGYRFVRGQVIAIVERRDKDSEESYRRTLQRTRWEVIVPELVFAPTNC
jgi:ATP-dependent DNA helicase RecQ